MSAGDGVSDDGENGDHGNDDHDGENDDGDDNQGVSTGSWWSGRQSSCDVSVMRRERTTNTKTC